MKAESFARPAPFVFGMNGSVPAVTVIVAARNAQDTMPELLDALAGQTLPRDRYEAIVVDDCSTDGTAEIIRRHGFAKLLRTPERGGAYVARNLALSEARGEVIAITDADCRPSERWLESGLADLEALGADVLGGHIEVPLRPSPTIAELVDFARYLDQQRALGERGFAATANLIAGREVFDKVGPFNESLISGGDSEWCERATEAGYGIAYSERASVYHAPRLTPADLARKAYRMGVGRAQINAHGHGRSRQRVRIWSRPGAYLVKRKVYGVERVYARGYLPSRRELVQMSLGQYFFVQLPLIAGNLAGSLRQTLAR